MRYSFLFSCFVLFSMAACTKWREEPLITNYEKPQDAFEKPPVENGRLKFTSEQELYEFYNSIEIKLNQMSSDSSFIVYEYLVNLAHELGYKSALEKFDESFVSEDRDSVPVKWLNDDIRLFILNEFYELEMGGRIFVYQSINQVYSIPDEENVIMEFQSTPKGDDTIIPSVVFERSDVILLSKLIEDKGEKRGGDDECYLVARLIERKEPCTPRNRYFYLILNQFWWPDSGSPILQSHSADVTFYYGDGSTEVRNDYSLSLIRFDHTYAESGTFGVFAVVHWFNPCTGQIEELVVDYLNPSGFDEFLPNTVQIEEENCQDANLSEGYWIQNGNYKMHAEIWFIDDFFGGHQGAKTTSYKYKNPLCCPLGWYTDNAYTLADINWHFRNSNCFDITVNGNVSGLETDWCNWCDSKRANKTSTSDGDFHLGDNEVFSRHYIENDGTIMTYDIVFEVCE